MKKYINLYALAAIAMFIGTACTDELEKPFEPIEIIAGEEIVFSASTAKQKSTRTIYGETNNDLIELNWAPGDYIHIASQDAAGLQVAEYQITMNSIATGNNSYDGDNTADGLVRVGSAGLQWSDADVYDFYAVYPSMTQLQGVIPSDVEGCGLTKEGVFTGYLPVAQTFDPSSPGNDGYVHEFKPNMSYAYMTAKTNWTRPENHMIDDASEMINLNFSSLTTGLKVTLVPGQIGNTNSEDEIEVFALSIFSESGKDICGKFEYNIADETFKLINDNSGSHSQITMNLPSGGSKLSSNNGSITATFFLLPVDITPGDLMLRVHYYRNGTPQFMTARLGIDIPVKKLTYINNLKMKSLTDEVAGSKWFAALKPDVYVSQVSIPVASNVFASSKYFSSGMDNSLQQVMDYTDLWDIGVRGFEFVNRRTVEITTDWLGRKKYSVDNDWSLSGAHFVVDENPYENDNVTFGTAFNTLAGKLAANPKETLVVICTYQAISDGYYPDGYVRQLLNYLDEFVANNTYKFTKDDFVQLTAASTVGDIQGKIAIIIRPGDDDRYEDDKYTSGISLTSKNNKDWSGNVLLIEDWGTAFDVWDRRYEGVAREAQFDIQYRKENKPDLPVRTLLEDWLWGAGGSSSDEYYEYNHDGAIDNGNNNFDNFGKGNFPKALDEFNYEHNRSDGGKAYVQEWARVVPESMAKKIYTGKNNNSVYLWVNWRESYTEKKQAIDGLFMKSVATKGRSDAFGLYINSLSGYYIIESEEGIYPFKQEYATRYYRSSRWRDGTIEVSNMGKGGDHVGLAYDLNKYVYGILSGESEMTNKTKLAEGPWGLVMMEHIGSTTKNDDKSIELVTLIMMNNFKFPLAQSSTPKSAPEVKISNEKLNPELPLLDWK